ncbi:MAG: PAS domain-containing protein, partial [Treponema sp.]|nr:PAS domain-containing protein [Treponema sp.]
MANIKKSFFVSLFRRMSPRSEQAREKTIAELEEKVRRLTAQAESAELKSRWLEVIFSSMFEGVVALDSKLTIIMVNPRLCSLFGFDKDARVNGMPLLSFSRSAELEEAARQVLSSGQPQELTIRRYTPGNEQHFRVFAAPLEESRGVAIVLGDISRLVKLEQVRKDFAANVSHELRTPIQVVKGFTETILDSPLDDKEEIRRFVGIIKKSVHLMETMTNDLLTLVSLEDGDSSRPSMEETLV